MGIAAPDVYVRQSAEPNAYTLAISGKKPFVVVTTSLIELLSPEELQVQDAAPALFREERDSNSCDHGCMSNALPCCDEGNSCLGGV